MSSYDININVNFTVLCIFQSFKVCNTRSASSLNLSAIVISSLITIFVSVHGSVALHDAVDRSMK